MANQTSFTHSWVFFDVGNVLLNDDPVMTAVFRHIWHSIREKGYTISFKDLMKVREEISARGPKLRIHHEVALTYLTGVEWQATRRRYLDDTLPRLQQLCTVLPGMEDLVTNLANRVSLGIIANQPEAIIPVLKKARLWKPFRVHGISQCVGLSKPDPEFYRWAIQSAECPPEKAIMIGDTVKYDIRPAREIGMKTVWFAAPPNEKHHEPADEFEEIYFESLNQQWSSRLSRVRSEVKPDGIAHSASQIMDALHPILDLSA